MNRPIEPIGSEPPRGPFDARSAGRVSAGSSASTSPDLVAELGGAGLTDKQNVAAALRRLDQSPLDVKMQLVLGSQLDELLARTGRLAGRGGGVPAGGGSPVDPRTADPRTVDTRTGQAGPPASGAGGSARGGASTTGGSATGGSAGGSATGSTAGGTTGGSARGGDGELSAGTVFQGRAAAAAKAFGTGSGVAGGARPAALSAGAAGVNPVPGRGPADAVRAAVDGTIDALLDTAAADPAAKGTAAGAEGTAPSGTQGPATAPGLRSAAAGPAAPPPAGTDAAAAARTAGRVTPPGGGYTTAANSRMAAGDAVDAAMRASIDATAAGSDPMSGNQISVVNRQAATAANALGVDAGAVDPRRLAAAAGASVVSARGVLGRLAVPGTAYIAVDDLVADHSGLSTKAFAVVTDDQPARIVMTDANWSGGFSSAKRAASAVEDELGRALKVAYAPKRPPLGAEAVAVSPVMVAVRLVPSSGQSNDHVRVAPVLDNAGYSLFAQPGQYTYASALAGGFMAAALVRPGAMPASFRSIAAGVLAGALTLGILLGMPRVKLDPSLVVIAVVVVGAAAGIIVGRITAATFKALAKAMPPVEAGPPRTRAATSRPTGADTRRPAGADSRRTGGTRPAPAVTRRPNDPRPRPR